jgi:FAD binding domain/D-arabinono-1,4-lactone oxidase
MATTVVERAADGFHHPAGEEELAALVRRAYREGRQLRVRGAGHSAPGSILTDQGGNFDVMLDRYRGWRVLDEKERLIEADAGIHLGADPGDPTGTATLETSLLWQLATERGWTLFDTGGVTHQTVSGFTATGSSGGSLQFTSDRNLVGFRVIDGTGEPHDFSRDDTDRFDAMAPNLGLLGVVSKIRFKCTDTFDVAGQEAVTTVEDCSIDLFGDGADGRPSLEEFLRGAEFARVEWWPQRGAERVLTWQCQRLAPQPGFRPCRYERFPGQPEAAQHLISLLYTILGNLGDLSRAKARLEDDFEHLEEMLKLLSEEKHLGQAGKLIATALSRAAEGGVDTAITLLDPLGPRIADALPDFFPKLLERFVPLDSDKDGIRAGEPQSFRDHSWRGLPMDNAASDVLMPTRFTEAWVPLPRTGDAMRLLRDFFSPPDDDEAYRRTGTYAWELYAAMPNSLWLSPAYSSGQDEWSEGAFRIDPYWFAESAADPRETLFGGLWALLRDADIPFRLHWGKYQPSCPPGDRTWVEFFRARYPRWDDFLRLRQELDPNNIFLTSYWRERFGLWDAPAPAPQS